MSLGQKEKAIGRCASGVGGRVGVAVLCLGCGWGCLVGGVAIAVIKNTSYGIESVGGDSGTGCGG